jgi:hypothetical protein
VVHRLCINAGPNHVLDMHFRKTNSSLSPMARAIHGKPQYTDSRCIPYCRRVCIYDRSLKSVCGLDVYTYLLYCTATAGAQAQ